MPMTTRTAEDYGPQLLTALRRVGLAISLLIAIYGAIVYLDIIPDDKPQSLLAVSGVSLLFLALGLIQYVHRSAREQDIRAYILSYHLLGALFITWIAGFDSPLTIMWVILAVVSGIHYGRRGYLLSLLTLVGAGAYNLSTLPAVASPDVFEFLLIIGVVAAVSASLMQLMKVQKLERKRLRHSRAEQELQRSQLLTLINSLSIGVVTTNSRGLIRLYNAAFLALLDTNRSLNGSALEDALHLTTTEGQPIDFKELAGDTKRPFERDDILLKLTDGEDIRLQINGAPIRGAYSSGTARTEGYVFVVRDVTKSKSLEEERDEFISVVSHELRTPITITEGTVSNLQLLLERGADTKVMVPALKEAHEQITYLASMVNDLGTLSRAERGVGDTPEEINLSELASELYHRYEPAAARKQLTLNLDAGRHLGAVTTSRLYLEEILQNFLTNAIKYTPKGTVTLKIHRRGSRIEFAVTDSGIGISRADQKRIFEKFYRSEDYRTRETSGTGLGLYVTNKLAHKLGVTIEVSSRLNHGSTFSFTMTEAKDSRASTPGA